MTQFTIPLPTYQCHKRVQALKISAVVPNPRGYEMHFEGGRFCPIEVVSVLGEPPVAGSYFVIDGDETSLVDAAAFEAGYTLVDAGPQWIKWSGGECPLSVGADAFVEHRSGSIMQLSKDRRGLWLHAGSQYDIVAYREIVGPATQAAREVGK